MTDRLLQLFWHEVDTRTGSGRKFADRLHMTQRAGWTMRSVDVDKVYEPLGVEGGIRRSLMNMEALAALLRSRDIRPLRGGLSVAVPAHLQRPEKPAGQIWRDFCAKNCTRFIDLFPVVFADNVTRGATGTRSAVSGDVHCSPAGNRLLFQALAKELM